MTKNDKELVKEAIYSAKDSIVFGGTAYRIGINDYIGKLMKKIEAIPIDANDPDEDDCK